MKKFVKILSKKNVRVTPGLDYVDNTNVDAHVGDRLRVTSAWARATILIKEGSGLYPAQIKNWNTVKSLVKNEIIEFGAETDEGDEEAEAMLHQLESAKANYASRAAANKKAAASQHVEHGDESVGE